MKRSHIFKDQLEVILKDHDAGASIGDLCRKYGDIGRGNPESKR
jgi:hypothetical protein